MHSHPDYLVYGLGDGKVQFTSPLGETADVELKTGDVMWRDAEERDRERRGHRRPRAPVRAEVTPASAEARPTPGGCRVLAEVRRQERCTGRLLVAAPLLS